MTQTHYRSLIGIVFTMVTITSSFAQVEERTMDNSRIEGVWSWRPGAGDCVERYEFRRDGSTLLSSGEEKLEGTYRLGAKPEANTKRYQLRLNIIRDHGGRDCTGAATDDTGASITEYIEFDTSGESLTMCRDSIGAECFGPLRKRVEGAEGERSPPKATLSVSPSVSATVASHAHSRAQRLLYAGRIDSAVSAWEQGMATSPDNVESLAALGATLYANGEPARAAVFMERAIAKARDDWPLRILHAMALELSGQRERAEREFDAIAADSPNAMIRDIARALRERKSLFRDPTAIAPEVATKLGIAAIPSRTWIGVLQQLSADTAVSKADAGIVGASARQLTIAEWAGVKELAPVLGFGRHLASARSPHHVGGLFTVYFGQSAMVTTFSYTRGRYLTVFRAWKNTPQEGNPTSLHQIASVFDFIGDILRTTGGRKPDGRLLIDIVMGAVRADEGNLSEAEQFYRLALSRLPNNPQARTLLAGVHLAIANREAGPVRSPRQAEKYQTYLRQAESELEVALKQWPDYSKALLNLGLVRDLQGRHDEAIALAEQAAALRPSFWEAYGNLACKYKEADRVDQARDAFARLEETAPEQSNRFAKCAVGLPQAK